MCACETERQTSRGPVWIRRKSGFCIYSMVTFQIARINAHYTEKRLLRMCNLKGFFVSSQLSLTHDLSALALLLDLPFRSSFRNITNTIYHHAPCRLRYAARTFPAVPPPLRCSVVPPLMIIPPCSVALRLPLSHTSVCPWSDLACACLLGFDIHEHHLLGDWTQHTRQHDELNSIRPRKHPRPVSV
jgi:hypothetical protein